MRWALVISFVSALAVPATAADDPKSPAMEKTPASGRVLVETVIAKVNDEIITRQSFERSFRPRLRELQDKFRDKPLDLVAETEKAKKAFLENMIDNFLLTQKAKSAGVKVSEDEVREVVDRLMLENNIKTQEEFVLALKSEGIDYEDFKSDMRNQGFREKYIGQEIVSKLSVSDAEIKKFYDDNPDKFLVPARTRVREIGLGDGRAEAERNLAKVQAALRSGAKFEDVAKEMSLAPSRDRGGDLGWFAKGDLDPAIEAALLKLKPGDVSDMIGTNYGYRVVKVEERQEAGRRPLDEVKDDVREYLKNQKYNDDLHALVVKLREQADIRYKDERGVLVQKTPSRASGKDGSGS